MKKRMQHISCFSWISAKKRICHPKKWLIYIETLLFCPCSPWPRKSIFMFGTIQNICTFKNMLILIRNHDPLEPNRSEPLPIVTCPPLFLITTCTFIHMYNFLPLTGVLFWPTSAIPFNSCGRASCATNHQLVSAATFASLCHNCACITYTVFVSWARATIKLPL